MSCGNLKNGRTVGSYGNKGSYFKNRELFPKIKGVGSYANKGSYSEKKSTDELWK